MEIYTLIGEFVFWIILALLVLIIAGLILGHFVVRKNRIFLPRFTLWILDILHFPIEKIACFINKCGLVDKTTIEVMNLIDKSDFAKTGYNERVVFLPHCLRSLDCPAKISYQGLDCIKCNKCRIKQIKVEADKLGYPLCIAPGGRFVERYCKKNKPKAAICVACSIDLSSTMNSLSDSGIFVQGISLSKTGCIETEVDVDEVIKRMRLKD
ncbi:MAG: hypothetical protein CVT90_00050 [Candidatus Altiarchaeales archaeon HGW-Altiarchaeales-3]|nr:MAG: hypothetical protein CVT90_00050 [Candidatus Altiarchaeales archaeon HGW-Altiarchaeales-3]